jgi:hypothetical protein
MILLSLKDLASEVQPAAEVRTVGLVDLAIAASHPHQRAPAGSWLVSGIKCHQGPLAVHPTCYQPRLMDDELLEIARHHAYGSLGLDPDPGLAFVGVRALREPADFCESYQVRRLREAGHSWAAIAAWAGVSPQAVHHKYARAIEVSKGTPT